MGIERKAHMTKLGEANEQFVLDWQASLLPVEVSISSLINAAVTIARTRGAAQLLPRKARNENRREEAS
jgi:hypothetical protein